MTEKISRAALERMLMELTGFSADSAEIARVLVVIDTYAAEQHATPSPLTESLLHLLSQQGELLLDSGQSFTTLRRRQDELERRQDEVARIVSSAEYIASAGLDNWHEQPLVELTEEDRAIVRASLPAEREAAAEITRMTEGWDELTVVSGESRPAEILPEWERRLLEEQAAGIRDAGTHFEVFCHSCREWKGSTMFFKNQKSKTGYETKCRDCRKAKAA